MNEFFSHILFILNAMKENFAVVGWIILGLFIIQIVNAMLKYRLNLLGIYPRSTHGVIGVFVSPFLHGNFNHFFFNAIPLFMLANFVMLSGIPEFIAVTFIIIVLSGFAVWCFGRKALHVGASGVIMGYFGYLLVNAYHHPSALTIIIAIVLLYYFGGMLLNLIPNDVKVSWEGHVFGFAAGIAAAYLAPYLLQ